MFQEYFKDKLLKKKNVIGHSMNKDGTLHVYVEKKYSDATARRLINDNRSDFNEKDLVKSKEKIGLFKKAETHVIQIGKIKSFEYLEKKRPLQGGVQIAPASKKWKGTLGGHVYKTIVNTRFPVELIGWGPILNHFNIETTTQYYGITNRHVVCTEYNDVTTAQNNFVQPWASSEIVYKLEKVGSEQYDCALLQPTTSTKPNSIVRVGTIYGIRRALPGIKAQKHGYRTGYTTGECIQTNVTITIDFGGTTGLKKMKGLDMYTYMSDRGDSGSWIVDMDGYVLTLLNAGSSEVTLGIPFEKVLQELQVEV